MGYLSCLPFSYHPKSLVVSFLNLTFIFVFFCLSPRSFGTHPSLTLPSTEIHMLVTQLTLGGDFPWQNICWPCPLAFSHNLWFPKPKDSGKSDWLFNYLKMRLLLQNFGINCGRNYHSIPSQPSVLNLCWSVAGFQYTRGLKKHYLPAIKETVLYFLQNPLNLSFLAWAKVEEVARHRFLLS